MSPKEVWNLRLDPEMKALWEQAALKKGQSLSDFVRTATTVAAVNTNSTMNMTFGAGGISFNSSGPWAATSPMAVNTFMSTVNNAFQGLVSGSNPVSKEEKNDPV